MYCTRFELENTAGVTTPGADHPPISAPDRAGRPRSLFALAAAAVLAAAVLAVGMVAGATEPIQELTLVARDMAFYLPDGTEPNPPLQVTASEQVRLTLVNRDAGIEHDLAVTTLGVESPVIPGDGSSITVSFRAPREAGEHEYLCQLHGRMMRGTLVVR